MEDIRLALQDQWDHLAPNSEALPMGIWSGTRESGVVAGAKRLGKGTKGWAKHNREREREKGERLQHLPTFQSSSQRYSP